MTEEFLKEAEAWGLVFSSVWRDESTELGSVPISETQYTLTTEGKQWMSDTLAKERGRRYDQAARALNKDLYAKLGVATVETATWATRCEDGWDADLLCAIITRQFYGVEVKITNWISLKRYLAEKDRGIDTALIYAGQFEQRVMEELGC